MKRTLIYRDTIRRLNRSAVLRVYHQTKPIPGIHGQCFHHMHGADITLTTHCVAIQTIVHEVHHAIDWFAALDIVCGREDEAHRVGLHTEEIIAAMLRRNWKYGQKNARGMAFNLDQPLALIRIDSRHSSQ